jgi:hypothetical protein
MLVLVDLDPIVYRAGFAAQTTEYAVHYEEAGEEITNWYNKASLAKERVAELQGEGYQPIIEKRVTPEPVQNALYNVKSMLETTCKDLHVGLDSMIGFLSGKKNFRFDVAKTLPYKGNRDETHKPIHAQAIKDFMVKTYEVVTSDNCEADDLLSIYQHESRDRGEDSVICTIDKDLDMVPGFHYNYVKRESYYVADCDAPVYFWRQMLTGDSVDNIPGIKGIGKKTAEKMLPFIDDPPHYTEYEMYEVVRKAYEKEYGDKADEMIIEVGRLLWMQTYHGEMWMPPKPDHEEWAE